MRRQNYVLIVGQGRSGTNWLLQLLDLSETTFCRNEPYGATTSPFNQDHLKRHRWVVHPDQRSLEEHWDEAASWTGLRMGNRDPRVKARKKYLHESCRVLGPYRAVHGPRLRRMLSSVMPSLRGEEWRIPWWLGSQDRLENSLAVLKLVAPPGWATFVLRNRPGVPVLHIIRHPGGFLNSWSTRYAAHEEPGEHRLVNHQRLREIAAVSPEWSELFGDIDEMDIDESELWYWYYANEVVFRAGSASTDYHHVIYEDLVEDPVGVMRPLYAACGLAWNSAVEQSIRKTAVGSNVAGAWRENLTQTQLDLVERFCQISRSSYAPDGPWNPDIINYIPHL